MEFSRLDKRRPDELRAIHFEADIAPNAPGSVLVSFGNTRVICAAMVEKKVPPWMRQQGVTGGWISAEYSMLPYSTPERKQRDIANGRLDGRTVEIQRLIGRSIRACADLQKLPDHTLWIDCDVIQADGGTRTAAINGAYVAARIAIEKLVIAGALLENPIIDSIAAVSVGIFNDHEILDLNYREDKDAAVDFNIVMTGSGRFVEVQGSGEEATFSDEQLQKLLTLARAGIQSIILKQELFLKANLPKKPDDSSASSAPIQT